MGIADELRARASDRDKGIFVSTMSPEDQKRREESERQRKTREEAVRRAVEQIREIAVEANNVLLDAGVEPPKLRLYQRPSEKNQPVAPDDGSEQYLGYGWMVGNKVVIDLWGWMWLPHSRNKSSETRGATEIVVYGDRLESSLPVGVELDSTGLYTETVDLNSIFTRFDFIEEIKNGYADILRFHAM